MKQQTLSIRRGAASQRQYGPEETPVEESVAYAFYSAARFLRRHLLGLADRNGLDLTPEQWFILNRLRAGDAVTQVELCDGTLEGHPNMTRILTSMERKGLVAQAPDPIDRRKKRIFLTSTGKRAHDCFAAIVEKNRIAIFRAVDPTELKALTSTIQKIEENVNSYNQDRT